MLNNYLFKVTGYLTGTCSRKAGNHSISEFVLLIETENRLATARGRKTLKVTFLIVVKPDVRKRVKATKERVLLALTMYIL